MNINRASGSSTEVRGLAHRGCKRRYAKRLLVVTGYAMLNLFLTQVAVAQGVLPSKVPIPNDNPMTAAKIKLGKQLYFDPRLSSSGTISCNSCHNVMGNGTDNRSISLGVFGKLDKPRNTPGVFNAAFHSVQFWDGRAPSLEEQAKGPLLNPVEMGMPSGKAVVARVMAIPGYRTEFVSVFGGKDSLTFENIVKAIATYERTLITPNSPYDRFVQGDKTALSDAAQRGLRLVKSTGCLSCHSGSLFSGPKEPAGQGFYVKFPTFTNNKYVKKYNLMADMGRFGVTHKAADKHMWHAQSWRNVALTAPYFHNGSVKTLSEAVRVMAKTQLDKVLPDGQVKDIVAFLDSLTGQFPKETMPRLPQTPNTTDE